ncbi:MAG: peptidase MA family metallohydrolase [Planctomycetota bacterium]
MFPSHARRKAARILETFPRRRARVAAWLGVEPLRHPHIYLVEDYAQMRARGGEGVPEWAVAIARRDGVLVFRLDRLDRTLNQSLDLVLKHEVVHYVLADLDRRPRPRRLPRWFEEGLCVHHAGVAYVEADTTLERMAAAGRLPAFADVEELFFVNQRGAAIAYKLGNAVVEEFLRRFGDDALRRLLRAFGGGQGFQAAFLDATGTRLGEVEERWRESITPPLPLLLFVMLENIELTLLCFGALLVVGGYIRVRLRRPRELERLGDG